MDTTTTFFRGDDRQTGGRWYARSREYAAFFGTAITEVAVPRAAILDLRAYGVGEGDDTTVEIDGMPAFFDYEIYQYVERPAVQAAARALGYRAIRCLQWHADYDEAPQDTLYLL